MSTSGSVRSLSIDGISFDVMSDANLSGLLNEFENDMIPTSGSPMLKKMRRIVKVESVVLATNWAEKEVLIEFADQLDLVTFSIEYASGTILKTKGTFNIESDESEENRTSITILPSQRWSSFIA